MSKKVKNDDKSFKVGFYIIMAVILFFAINLIGFLALNKYDLDLTSDKVFTLSDSSKKILSELEEPIKLKFFYSNKAASGIPALKSYGARIRGLLEEYVANSNGNIKLEVIDPEPFSTREDKAVAYGIKGIDIDKMGTKIYFGLVAKNSVDDTKTIPFFSFDDEQFLEYEFTRTVYDLANPKRKRIGLLSSIELGAPSMFGIPGLGGAKWFILQKISQTFDVKKIETDVEQIPDDIDVLMVVQPKGFSQDVLYAIDQYVLKGGRAIIFVDPNKEGGGTGTPSDRSFSGDINKLLNVWGVRTSPYIVAGDRDSARKFDKLADTEQAWKYVDYVAWLGIKGSGINKNDIATSGLKVINMNTAGIIEPLTGASIEVVPLITTSKNSMKIMVNKVRNSPDVNSLLRNFVPDNNEYILSARLSGIAKTAFPNSNRAGHVESSGDKINVIVVSDTDLLRDETWSKTQDAQGYKIVMQHADNAKFIVNALDNLSGSGDLINLRSRGAMKRPFTTVDEIKREAEERYLQKEQELKSKLADTEQRLSQLKQLAQTQSGNRITYKNRQKAEIKRFTDEMVQVKKELRNVQGELRKDIEGLGSILKFINIWLMPLLVIAFAVFMFVMKNKIYKKK